MDLPPSFELAREMTTQLLTLATAVIGVSATFAKDISPQIRKGTRRMLYASWLFFLVSVICGLATLGTMAGFLGRSADAKASDVYNPNITFMAKAQVVCFLVGIILLVVHAISRLRKP